MLNIFEHVLQETSNKSIVLGCVIPQVEVTLVMPSQTPGKESSGGDAESVLPDSASLGDDLHFNNSGIWATQMSLDHVKGLQNCNPFGSVEMPSPISNEPPPLQEELPHHISNPNTHGYNVQIVGTPVQPVVQLQQPSPTPPSSSSRSRNRNSISDTSLKEFSSSK